MIHLQRDLEKLKREILAVGAMVETSLTKAVVALVDRRSDAAREVIALDDRIDAREVEVEEDCLKMLALHQPVAADLRFIVAVLKVNNDLERIGDHAANIAESALYLTAHDPIGLPPEFGRMVERVRVMVRESLDALVRLDTSLAWRVTREDDEVDAALAKMYVVLQDLMHRDPKTIERAVYMLTVARHLERIADLAVNIAEDVVFMVEGEVVRHRMKPESQSPRGSS